MRKIILLASILTVRCFCQTSTGPAQTKGPCSPAVTGNNNRFTFYCDGVGTEQGSELLRIVNKILENQLDLDVVVSKLDEIGKDVKGLRRGIYQGYDFNGAKREQSPGRSVVIAGEEIGIFQQMLKLQSSRQWPELLKLADDQIKKTPDWLTPYLFSGAANLQLGNRDAAISRLQFVETQAAGDPAYADATRILRQLRK